MELCGTLPHNMRNWRTMRQAAIISSSPTLGKTAMNEKNIENAPLQSPALQSTKILFEKENINRLSSFVLGKS